MALSAGQLLYVNVTTGAYTISGVFFQRPQSWPDYRERSIRGNGSAGFGARRSMNHLVNN